MDVLYSLTGVQGFDLLVQSGIFTNVLDLTAKNVDDSINESILNRFCNDILPQIQHNVQSLIVEATDMDRILHAGAYSNLTHLKITKFHAKIFSQLCTDELLFRSNFKKQITHLTLINYYPNKIKHTVETTNVYVKVLDFFENLNSLDCNGSYVDDDDAVLSFYILPSNAFVSSNLTTLSITLHCFEDCLCLLDGRLSQLSTLTVIIFNGINFSLTNSNSNDIPTLRYFSLTYKSLAHQYDTQVVPLVRQMCNLQHLTLYIDTSRRNRFVDGIQLENDILIHLSRLQTFVFYICTSIDDNPPDISLLVNDIQRTFSHAKFGQVGYGVNYNNKFRIKYNIFSLPYTFDRIESIGNKFTDTIFNNITSLTAVDNTPFEHEFFVRLARCFPLLKRLMIENWQAQSIHSAMSEYDNINESIEVVVYAHLISLRLSFIDIDYVEQMLNESKTRLPSLKKLTVDYDQLKSVTHNFTRDATRLNCVNIEELDSFSLDNIVVTDDDKLIVKHSKDFYDYFPSLNY